MLRSAMVAALALLVLAGPASAQSGVNLSWNDCGSAGTMLRTFACNTNTGDHTMVASFACTGVTQLTALAGVIDLCSMDPVLPAWWQMRRPDSCRPNAISASFDFTGGAYNGCTDYWQGQATGTMTYTYGQSWGFNGARIVASATIPQEAATALENGVEYYAFRITIRNDATVGDGACARCQANVCIILNSVELYQPTGVGNFFISGPLTRDYMHWQGQVVDCPFVVPARNRSWGQIKSLYR